VYQYWKLSPEEREEILRQRRERGYPLHAPPHPFRCAGYYFITAVNYQHKHLMATSTRRTDFESRLLAAVYAVSTDISAWVILPNHYHFLVGVETLDAVSSALKHLHGTTSHEWNLEDNSTGARRVWYKFTDRLIRNEKHFYGVLNYIHYNPVKHGYVRDTYDWLWSSLNNYREAHGQQWLREKWTTYPIGDLKIEDDLDVK